MNPPLRPPQPVLRNISHTGHLIGTVLTLGAWAPLWLVASLVTAHKNRRAQEAYALALSEYEYQMAFYGYVRTAHTTLPPYSTDGRQER